MTYEEAEKLVRGESYVFFYGNRYRFAGLCPQKSALRKVCLLIYNKPPSLHIDTVKISSCRASPVR